MRAPELGLPAGRYPRGATDAITDVDGVFVGHCTVRVGDTIRTGVTAVVPRALVDEERPRRAVPAGLFVGNGHGKLIGATQLIELGELETPILLTSTLSAFAAADALVAWHLARPGRERVISVNPVVGETNDGALSDIRSRPIRAEHVDAALEAALAAPPGAPPAEGCVGAGTGTCALGYKGGIGTASRVVEARPGRGQAHESWTVGALVQTNFSGSLTVSGVPVPADEVMAPPCEADAPGSGVERGNSCMIVVATDAPLDARQLGRLCRRAMYAMARVGADYAHGSGDYALAFTTARSERPRLDDRALDPLFTGVLDAVEEALLNSLFEATTTHGFGGAVAHAVPEEALRERLASVIGS